MRLLVTERGSRRRPADKMGFRGRPADEINCRGARPTRWVAGGVRPTRWVVRGLRTTPRNNHHDAEVVREMVKGWSTPAAFAEIHDGSAR